MMMSLRMAKLLSTPRREQADKTGPPERRIVAQALRERQIRRAVRRGAGRTDRR